MVEEGKPAHLIHVLQMEKLMHFLVCIYSQFTGYSYNFPLTTL